MKKEFCGFYSTPNESLQSVWRDDSTLFVLDANCLLNLYRCEDGTREDILKVMKVLSPRIWIPFQVGYEYQKNRRNVIDDSITSLLKIKDELIKYYNQSILDQAGIKKHLYNKLSSDLSEFQESLQKSIDTFISDNIDKRIENKKSIANHDSIRDELDIIINENVGSLPTQAEIDEINKRGETRYERKIPPGFKDNNKKGFSYFSDITVEDKYGDLYLWEQVIEKAKDENIKTVIFVTDDVKEDWVFIHKGKNRGALESLKTEICKRANLNNFRLINQLSFLREAKDHINGIDVSNETFNEVQELVMTPVHAEDSEYVDAEFYEHDLPNSYDLNIDKSYTNHYKSKNYSKNLFYNETKELFARAANAFETFISLEKIVSKNLNTMQNFKEELEEMYGENSMGYVKRKLTAQKGVCQFKAFNLRARYIINNRFEKVNFSEFKDMIEDVESHILKLQDVNTLAESYIDTLL